MEIPTDIQSAGFSTFCCSSDRDLMTTCMVFILTLERTKINVPGSHWKPLAGMEIKSLSFKSKACSHPFFFNKWDRKKYSDFSTYRQHSSRFLKGSSRHRVFVILNICIVTVELITVPEGKETLISENLQNCCPCRNTSKYMQIT